MTTTIQQQRFTRYKRLGITLGVIAALAGILALLIIFWLPGYAKSQLEIRLSGHLQRPVTLASLELKLGTLELILRDFRVGEKAGSDESSAALFSFSKLHVDLSMESLRHRAPVITAVTLADPQLRLVRESADRFNVSDLLEQFNQPADEEKTGPDQISPFSISNITIQGGHLELLDRHKNTKHAISEINLGIPVVANLDSIQTNWIEPHFSAKINGSPFSLDGKINPFAARQEAALAVKLNNIDLMRFGSYLSLPQGIRLLSGYYDSDLLLTFSQESGKAPDITLTGSTAIRQLAFKNSAVAAPYQANLKTLRVTLTQADLAGKKPSRLKLNIGQAALTRDGENEPAISLARLTVPDITVNTASQQIALGVITLDGFNTTLRRDAQGDIDIAQLFNSAQTQTQTQAQARMPIPIPARKPAHNASAIQIAGKEPEARASAPMDSGRTQSSAPRAPWAPQIKSIQFKAATLRYEDLTLTKVAPMIVNSLDLTLDNIDPDGVNPLNLSLQAQVNQRGNIKAHGSLAWSPLAADVMLSLDAVDLVSLQGWLGDKLTALLTSGDVSFTGNIKASGTPVKIHATGQGKLANFNIFNPKAAHDLLRWKRLDIGQLSFTSDPLLLDISTIHLGDFYARMTILPDGSLNLRQIIQQEPAAQPAIPVAAAGSAANGAAGAEAVTPIHIDKIFLQHGSINFNDRFIKPNYRANLSGLSGQIGPLYPGKSGKIDIHGMVSKTAPLEISGTIDPFSAELSLDIIAKVKNIDLPPFSPYSGKYIGYGIEKGKLSADVNYQIEKGALTADNQIFLDQFTLGDKIDSENAVSLPLDLAITLLKNRRGEINLHLPLKGSINDPRFNLGDIIFEAFINLITKAITSPFALLGSVLEGGAELSEISFTPGFADIDAESLQRLQALAGVLKDRPSLRLEISGHVDPVEDHEGLKLALLQNKVKAQKLAEDAGQGIASGAIADVTLTPEEYSKYLKMAYKKETFEKPTNVIGLAKSLPDAEMEQLMLTHTVINDNDLQVLAENRAVAARNWLVENGEIASERIFVVGAHETGESDEKKGSRAEFSLK